jgi:TrmH family RNA methyltransferase
MSNSGKQRIWEALRRNIAVILVEPEHPGNIGAAARAMNNMGLSELVLINPVEYTKETYWLAHASEEILENAKILNNFEELFTQFDFLFATSNRGRENKEAQPLQRIIPEILNLADNHKIGIVFGRENKGLFNSELYRCRAVIRIPAFNSYPSLNLSQAVMVTVYELFTASLDFRPENSGKIFATDGEKESLTKHFLRTVETIKYYPANHEEHWTQMEMLFRNFLNSGKMDKKHLRMLHKYFAEIENYARYRAEEKNET